MGFSDITGKVSTSRPVVPQIYAYTTPEIRRHDGWTKIGYTEQDVRKRIAQQTHTADVEAKLEWHGNATYENTGEVFHDTDFHAYLRRLGIEGNTGTEWFHIGPSPLTASSMNSAKTTVCSIRPAQAITSRARAEASRGENAGVFPRTRR